MEPPSGVLCSPDLLDDVLISSQDWCKEVAPLLDTLEHRLRRQGTRLNGAGFQFLPGQWGGDERASGGSTQRIWRCGVAPQAILCRINRDTSTSMRRPMGEGKQIRKTRHELLPDALDPAADRLERGAGPEGNQDMQATSPAGLRIALHACLFKESMQP